MPDITPGQALAGPPDTSALPIYSRIPQTLPVNVAPPTPQQQTDAKHAALGKAVRFLYGSDVDDQGNPVRQRPGQIFRSLLASALIGGAIGGESPNGGFLGGFMRGGAGVEQQNYARQQQALANQRQEQQLSLEDQRAQDEHILHQATVAHLTTETTAFHHQQALHDQEALDKKNAAARQYLNVLDEAGARPAAIAINGQVPANGEYSAPDLYGAIVRDPSILTGKPGTVRHFVDLQNAGDLNYVPGKGWVNDSGTPVDLTKSTVVKVLDTPESLYRQPLEHTGTELNAIAGYQLIPKADEGKTFVAPLDAVAALYATNLKNLNAAAQAKQREASAAKSNAAANKTNAPKRGTPEQFAQLESKKAAALAKAEASYRKGDMDETDLANAKAAAQKAYEDGIVALGGSVAKVQVTDPRGVVHTFPNQQAADAFKQAAGIR